MSSGQLIFLAVAAGVVVLIVGIVFDISFHPLLRKIGRGILLAYFWLIVSAIVVYMIVGAVYLWYALGES